MQTTPYPAVSVVVPTNSEKRWSSRVRTVESVRTQQPAEIVVVVDHNPTLRVERDLAGVTVQDNAYDRGASGNRNTGAAHTRTPLTAFLDDDTAACPGWLAAMVTPFAELR